MGILRTDDRCVSDWPDDALLGTVTTTGEGETIGKALSVTSGGNRIVYGKLIDLGAQVADPKIHIAVVQQRVD